MVVHISQNLALETAGMSVKQMPTQKGEIGFVH